MSEFILFLILISQAQNQNILPHQGDVFVEKSVTPENQMKEDGHRKIPLTSFRVDLIRLNESIIELTYRLRAEGILCADFRWDKKRGAYVSEQPDYARFYQSLPKTAPNGWPSKSNRDPCLMHKNSLNYANEEERRAMVRGDRCIEFEKTGPEKNLIVVSADYVDQKTKTLVQSEEKCFELRFPNKDTAELKACEGGLIYSYRRTHRAKVNLRFYRDTYYGPYGYRAFPPE